MILTTRRLGVRVVGGLGTLVLLAMFSGELSEAAPARAEMRAPTPGTILSGSQVTFTWTAGSEVQEYWLYVGTTPGGAELLSMSAQRYTSLTITGLPTNGKPVYVVLWSYLGGTWEQAQYQYTAAQAASTLSSRAAANANGTCWQDFAHTAYAFRSWLCVEDDYEMVTVDGTIRCSFGNCLVIARAGGRDICFSSAPTAQYRVDLES